MNFNIENMTTIIWIIAALLVAGGVVIYFVKAGKIKDSDGDLIPDVVEEKVAAAKKTAKEVKRRAKNVKAELKDVIAEAKDVSDAVKGKKPRKPRRKKQTK